MRLRDIDLGYAMLPLRPRAQWPYLRLCRPRSLKRGLYRVLGPRRAEHCSSGPLPQSRCDFRDPGALRFYFVSAGRESIVEWFFAFMTTQKSCTWRLLYYLTAPKRVLQNSLWSANSMIAKPVWFFANRHNLYLLGLRRFAKKRIR